MSTHQTLGGGSTQGGPSAGAVSPEPQPCPASSAVSSKSDLSSFISSLSKEPLLLDVFKLAEMLACRDWMSVGSNFKNQDKILHKCVVLAQDGDWVEKIELDVSKDMTDCTAIELKIRIAEETRNKPGSVEFWDPGSSSWISSSEQFIEKFFPTRLSKEAEAARAQAFQQGISGSIIETRRELLEEIIAIGQHLKTQPIEPAQMNSIWSSRFLGKLDDRISYDQLDHEMQHAAGISERAMLEFHTARDKAAALIDATHDDPVIRPFFDALASLKNILLRLNVSMPDPNLPISAAINFPLSDAKLLILSNGDLRLEETTPSEGRILAANVGSDIIDVLLRRWRDPEASSYRRNVERLDDIRDTIVKSLNGIRDDLGALRQSASELLNPNPF